MKNACALMENHMEKEALKIISPKVIAKFYAMGLVDTIKAWLLGDDDSMSAEEVYNTYVFLLSHSILDIIDR